MNEARNNPTLSSVLGQGYFSFMDDFSCELTAEEKALVEILGELSYAKFNQGKRKGSVKADPYAMCLLIIYAGMNGHYTSRMIERFSRRNVFAMAVLGNGVQVDHTTINRFIKDNGEAIEDMLFQTVRKLKEMGEIKGETVLQDGTKIESRAGKYTFQWKGSCEKNADKCVARLVDALGEAKALGVLDEDVEASASNAYVVAQEVLGKLEGMDLPSAKAGRGHKADKKARLKERLREDAARLRELDETIAAIGDDRKSMSRTDPDATFMRMKEDAMGNGQLKPAYNIQNALDSGYVVASYISRDRTDYNTCIPLMEKLDSAYGWKYSNYVADSGYDCIDNFRYLEKEGINAYIKPQDWETNKKKSARKDIGSYKNMAYEEEKDVFVCANGCRLHNTGKVKTDKRSGAEYREYSCTRGCKSCPLRKKCMKGSRKGYKSFSVCFEHWRYREKAAELLSSDTGIEMRLNRSIMTEGSFAQVKSNIGFRRFFSFGMQRAFTEWTIHVLAMDILHFANRHYGAECLTEPDWHTMQPKLSA